MNKHCALCLPFSEAQQVTIAVITSVMQPVVGASSCAHQLMPV